MGKRKTRKSKRKAKRSELARYVMHCPIIRFKLKREKIVGLSDSLKEMYDTCH